MNRTLVFLALFLTWSGSYLFSQTPPKINDLTGINALPDDPREPQKRFSWVRAWHDWSNDIGYPSSPTTQCLDPSNENDWSIRWNPSYYPNGALLRYDEWYGGLNGTAIPVLKGIAPHFRGFLNYPGCSINEPWAPLEQKSFCSLSPYLNDDDCDIPDINLLLTASQQEQSIEYESHALWLSLFAAKYGQATYPLNFVDGYLHSEEAPVINLQAIQYLEDGNEPNRTWYDNSYLTAFPNSGIDISSGKTFWYFTPKQYAAMLKADMDGDGGVMQANGQDLGILKASEGVGVVMGGLTGLNGQYVNEMIAAGASGFKPNFHHYCTDLSAAQDENLFMDINVGEFFNYEGILVNGSGGSGVSPERDHFREKLKLVGEQIGNFWLTEFGYDSFVNDPDYSGVETKEISGEDGIYDSQKVQAQWLVRGVLEAAWSGVVDKMMLYELTDHPELGNTSYASSGIMTDDGVGKRAWFYVMTLKNVLGEYFFKREIEDHVVIDPMKPNFFFDVQINSANPLDVPRIYEFRNNDDEIVYSIWSPTESANAVYTCDITFPTGIISGDPKYDLNGGATLIKIQELNEKGHYTDWSNHVSGQTISDIPVSETPVFLILNKVEPESPTVPHVTGLNCKSVCCGSVKLTWNPPGVNTPNTLVFYREKAAGQPCPPFSFTESTLFTQNLGINRTAAIVTGLEVGKEYCFYVIPIGLRGNPPDNLDVAPFCSTTVADCSGCLINISASELSFDPEYENWNSGNLQLLTEDALEILSIQDGNPNTCAEIYGSCDPLDTEPTDEGWQFWWDPAASNPLVPEPNTIFINFDTPKELSAVYAQDWNGRGNILIEYESCDCPDVWFKLTTLNLEGKPYCHADGSYETIHVPVALKKVSKLKITKLSNDGTIRRLYFCGSDTDCGPQPPDLITVGDPTNFRADEIRKNTAVLKWTAGSYDQSNPASDRMEAYTIALSQNVDSNNELVNPVEYAIQASPYEMDVFYRLSGLAPGTTYFADLKIRQYPCHTTFPGKVPLRTSFTTDSEEIVERENERPILRNEKTDNTFKVILTPNPASDNVRISVTKGEIYTILMMDNYGRQIETFSVNGQNVTTLSLEGHPPGIYWLRVIRTDRSNLTVLMVKMD